MLARNRIMALLAACGVAAASLTLAGTALAGAPTLPSSDPFYTYSGSTPLAQLAAGTVLASRSVTVQLNIASTPQAGLSLPGGPVPTIPAEQLLYRTADELGRPSATVTTVLVPAAAQAAIAAGQKPDIAAYLSFYDSLSPKCDPSYTLQGGDPDQNNVELSDVEQGLVAQYYALGFVVTVPDFEGEQLHWTAGHESAYGTLDAIRATESYLGAPADSPVGLSGYSGGSIAADWASELAPAYAPGINLVGVAEGGIPVDFAHNLTYINGSQVWSGIMPAVLSTLGRSYGLDLPTYASAYGLQLAQQDSNECIGDFSGTTPGLTIDKLLKPQYADILKQPVFVDIINKLLMGSAPGHPMEPLFMAVGNDPSNAQGQGDDIMVTGDVEALAHEYCSQGVTVQYAEYANAPHSQAALEFEPAATQFLEKRFAGAAPQNDCASIPVGNNIDPIVLTPSSSGRGAKAAAAKHRTARSARAAGGQPAVQPAGSLAYTGMPTALSAVAALLVLAAATTWRVKRERR